MNIEYLTMSQYIECKSKIIGKVATYDILIEAMEKSILTAMIDGNGDAVGQIAEIEVDDSMMRVRTRYRSINDMTNALNGLRKIRQDYINRYNGRVTVLRGGNL